MACYDATYIEERITKTKSMIDALEDAIEQLSIEGVYSYDFDTTQNRSRVTKQDLPRLIQEMDRLDKRLARLCSRLQGLSGGSVVQVVPAW